MVSILIIDDDEDVVRLLSEEIRQELVGAECHPATSFAEGRRLMGLLRPDAVVLDLREGVTATELPGEKAWRSLWSETFCPVVVYTAIESEIDPPVPKNHAFVKRVQKGAGSEREVIRLLQGFAPHVAAVRGLRLELDCVVGRVLRETAGESIVTGEDSTRLIHAARRRVAAMMDEATLLANRPLFAWEQYLIPAVGESPLAADVLLHVGQDATRPENYRLVLSPSCDLVKGRNESRVLVARCRALSTLTNPLSLRNNPASAAEKLKSQVLSQGFWNGMIPLPDFPGVIPAMVACLKDLEVIPYETILPRDGAAAEYRRVASIDSPFRELVSWAFLNTVGRPGMPDRDLRAWADEIVRHVQTPPPAPPAVT